MEEARPPAKRPRTTRVETCNRNRHSLSDTVSSAAGSPTTTTTDVSSVPSVSLSSDSQLDSPSFSQTSTTTCSNARCASSDASIVSSVNVASEVNTTETPNNGEVYKNVRFLTIAGTRVSLWLFPEGFVHSNPSTNISNTSTLTALLLGHIWLATKVDLPDDGPLQKSWFSSILYAATSGVDLSNESVAGARTLTLEEATIYLSRSRSVSIVLDKPATVRLTDPNSSLRLAHHLEKMTGMSAAIFIYANKATLFLAQNSSMMVIDSHRKGNVGAAIVKGDIRELPQFLKTLQSTLGLNEHCYGTFVNFS